MVDITATPDSPKQRGFSVAIAAAFAVLAKRASHLPLKLKAGAAAQPGDDYWKIELNSTPKPSAPKKLLSNISRKMMSFIQRRKNKKGEKEEFGVWQKAILMGDKCEPLGFSGIIYYDCNGMQVSEIPVRSPRVSPVPLYFVPHTPQRKL